MKAAIQLLRSNDVYRQVFSSIGENFANFETLDLSVGKREICLLAREKSVCRRQRSVCWLERDLSVGGRERSICWLGRDLFVGKTKGNNHYHNCLKLYFYH